MPTDNRDNIRPDLHPGWTEAQPLIAPSLQSSRKDVGLNDLTDSQTPAGFRPQGSDPTYCESHFGCARCVFWVIVFEAGMAIAALLCWQLRLLPSW
jgi:hypothetical protein